MTEPDTKLSLKLLVDKKANKVLFAEAGKDFVDFLFNLLSLPVGAVIRLITNSAMVGCVGNLYQSIESLNQTYVQPDQNKDLLLKPRVPNHVANVPLLLPDTNPAERKLYNCINAHRCVTDRKDTICAQCRNPMCHDVQFVGKNSFTAGSASEGGYVKGLVTYMVTDDLSVSPMSMISGVALLNKFSVKDFGALEERMAEFGINEGLELLKASLQSKAALTTVFLSKQDVKVDAASD
ncbi:unnamed protein product [Dovyalis caffra]|uniref:DUF674 domain-containing protein n=1 Tax=Dovyalis caffra TaxID=77055 RepID=A0AAV1QVG5_9ROSI|nr:unnamed protein product [Dovyalis caffra]